MIPLNIELKLAVCKLISGVNAHAIRAIKLNFTLKTKLKKYNLPIIYFKVVGYLMKKG